MEVSAVNLNDVGSLLIETFDPLGLVFEISTLLRMDICCLLMQRASPSINVALFTETKSVVVSASHLFGPNRHRDLLKQSQVDHTLIGQTKFPVKVRSTDVNFSSLGNDG